MPPDLLRPVVISMPYFEPSFCSYQPLPSLKRTRAFRLAKAAFVVDDSKMVHGNRTDSRLGRFETVQDGIFRKVSVCDGLVRFRHLYS